LIAGFFMAASAGARYDHLKFDHCRVKAMPTITQVIETSLYVDDLERSARFYEDVLGFAKMVADERFCALSVAGRQVLLLFKKGASQKPSVLPGGIIPPHDGAGQLHLAFAIDPADFEPWRRRLAERDVAVESTVRWQRGGQSLYFRDPDQHLVELITPGCWPIY
jgi:catechol 2,3-dioxygenase-like lactoylglutathione lyase family enzyme